MERVIGGKKVHKKRISIFLLIIIWLVIPVLCENATAENVLIDSANNKDIQIKISAVEVEKDSQHPDDQSKIFFEYKSQKMHKFFLIKIEIMTKPVNVVLVLDESSSLNNKDIEGRFGNKISRIDVEKSFARQLIDSINRDSHMALVIFGKDKIKEYDFGTERKNLRETIDNLTANGDKSKGGTALDKAIDFCEISDRNCIIIVMSDGLEIKGEYNLIDVIGRAIENKIPIFTVKLGQEKSQEHMKKLAEETNGKFYNVEKTDGMYSFTLSIIEYVNNSLLENVVLHLVSPACCFIEDIFADESDFIKTDSAVTWKSIVAGEKINLTTRIGVKKDEIDQIVSFLETNFVLLYSNPQLGTDHNLSFKGNPISIEIETKVEYYERVITGFLKKNSSYIAFFSVIFTITIFVFVKRKKDLLKMTEKMEYHISQAQKSKDAHDFESACDNMKKAIHLAEKLDHQEKNTICEELDDLMETTKQLEKEKIQVNKLVGEISILTEKCKDIAPVEYLKISFSDFEILKKNLGPHLQIENLGNSISHVLNSNDISRIKSLQEDLKTVKEILSENYEKIRNASQLYDKTKSTLEVLLHNNRLDVDRVATVIENPSMASLVLNFAISDHQELKCEWNVFLVDELRDEREAFLKALELVKKDKNYIQAKNLLKKALELSEDVKMSENINKALKECNEKIDNIYTQIRVSYGKGMELFKNQLYSNAFSKFCEAKTYAKKVQDGQWTERISLMMDKCEQQLQWEEQITAILNKMEEVNGIASTDWLARYVESNNIEDLLRYIRQEYNREGDETVHYRIYPYENPPVFIDFFALSKYIFDNPGEIGGKIPPNNLEIPVDVQKELLDLMKSFRR